MTTLSSHKKRLHTVVPDMSYVMKYTDQGPYPGNHWFWRDGRRNHGLDKRGQAYLRWTVKPTPKSGYLTHGDFNVVRLLITARRGELPPRTKIVLECGLSQCVNPDHWKVLEAAPTWRIEMGAHGLWRLVRHRTGKPSGREQLVHVRHASVVHLAAIASTMQFAVGAPRAVCGLELPPELSVVTDAKPSCDGCR
jgi:hypothetical protein